MRRHPDPIFPLLLSILAAVLLFGCATQAPLVRLHPNTGEDVFWMSGRAAVKKQRSGVHVAAAFEHQLGKRLGLRVEVRNGSGERIEVNPDKFSFVTCAGEDDSSCSDYKGVIDPEEVIESLDARRSRVAADAADNRAFNTAMVFLSAVGDITGAASGSSRGSDTHDIANRGDLVEAGNHARCPTSPPGGRCGRTRRCAGARSSGGRRRRLRLHPVPQAGALRLVAGDRRRPRLHVLLSPDHASRAVSDRHGTG